MSKSMSSGGIVQELKIDFVHAYERLLNLIEG